MTEYLYGVSENKLESMSQPCSETQIVEALGENCKYYFAVQPFFYSNDVFEFYAIRLRFLGSLTELPNNGSSLKSIYTELNQNSQYEKWCNSFQVVINKKNKSVKFGPRGNIMVKHTEHRGCGLGSFAFSLVIRYLKENYSDFRVKNGGLSGVDGGEDNFKRRNNFYENLGFMVTYKDNAGNGSFSANSVSQLKEHINTDKIKQIKIEELLKLYLVQRKDNNELNGMNTNLISRVDRYEKEWMPEKLRFITKLSKSIIILIFISILGWCLFFYGLFST